MSLRWQIALSLAAIAAVVGFGAGVGSYLSTERELRHTIDQSLATVANRFSNQSTDSRDRHDNDDTRDNVAGCPDSADLAPATDVRLITSTGIVSACITSSDGSIAMEEPVSAGYRTVDQGDKRYRVLVATTSGGAVQVARSLDEDDAVLARLRVRLAALVAAGIAVALVTGWALARSIARPIVRLRDTAEVIADTGDLDTPIPPAGRGEVASLSRSFGAMVAALATSRAQQRRLVDDASHEMRTPLTSLTTNLEHLDHFDRIAPDERREVLDAVQIDVAELTNLLNELVELATDRADDEEPELLSLQAVASDVAQRTARRSGRAISVGTRREQTATAVSSRPGHTSSSGRSRTSSTMRSSTPQLAPRSRSSSTAVASRCETGGRASRQRTATTSSTASTAPPRPEPPLAPGSAWRSCDRSSRATAGRSGPGSAPTVPVLSSASSCRPDSAPPEPGTAFSRGAYRTLREP